MLASELVSAPCSGDSGGTAVRSHALAEVVEEAAAGCFGLPVDLPVAAGAALEEALVGVFADVEADQSQGVRACALFAVYDVADLVDLGVPAVVAVGSEESGVWAVAAGAGYDLEALQADPAAAHAASERCGVLEAASKSEGAVVQDVVDGHPDPALSNPALKAGVAWYLDAHHAWSDSPFVVVRRAACASDAFG